VHNFLYPAKNGPEPATVGPKPRRPWLWALVAGVVVAAVAGGAVGIRQATDSGGTSSASTSSSSANAPSVSHDNTLGELVGTTATPKAPNLYGTMVNHTSNTATFAVTARVLNSADTVVATFNTTVGPLRPGEKGTYYVNIGDTMFATGAHVAVYAKPV
jgi:hypothetical protein